MPGGIWGIHGLESALLPGFTKKLAVWMIKKHASEWDVYPGNCLSGFCLLPFSMRHVEEHHIIYIYTYIHIYIYAHILKIVHVHSRRTNIPHSKESYVSTHHNARRLMFYLDHYRFLYKHRREHYDRRKYQARSVLFVVFVFCQFGGQG